MQGDGLEILPVPDSTIQTRCCELDSPICETLNHPLRCRLIFLQGHLAALLERIRLHKHLPRCLLLHYSVPYFHSPEVVYVGHVLIQLFPFFQIRRALVDVQLLQISLHCRTPMAQDLVSIDPNSEIGEIIFGIFQLREIIARIKECP